MVTEEEAQALRDVEETLLSAAAVLDDRMGLAARLMETWAHTTALVRADVDPDADAPGTIADYLDLVSQAFDGLERSEVPEPLVVPA